jgi:hypothetical protein
VLGLRDIFCGKTGDLSPLKTGGLANEQSYHEEREETGITLCLASDIDIISP